MRAAGIPFMVITPVDDPGYVHKWPDRRHTKRILACGPTFKVRQPGTVAINVTNVTDGMFWGTFQVLDTDEVIRTRSEKITVWDRQ